MKKILTACSLLALLALAAVASASPVAINLDKNTAEIGTFYNGTTVVATGQVPAGSEAVIRVGSRDQPSNGRRPPLDEYR